MSWSLNLSGHITGEDAAQKEHELFDKVKKFAQAMRDEYGVAGSSFSGQYTPGQTNFHGVTEPSTEAPPEPDA